MQTQDSTYDSRRFPVCRPTAGERGAECKRFQEDWLLRTQGIEADDDWMMEHAQRQRAGVTRGEELAATVVELAQQRVVPAAERHGG